MPRYGLLLLILLMPMAMPVRAGDEAPIGRPTAIPADHAERMKEGMALFKASVRQLLVEHCLECHGGQATKADFDLSSRESLMASGYVDQTAADSYLLSLVRHEEEPFMPFESPALADEEIALIARWIDLGAPYDRPLVDPAEKEKGESPISQQDRAFWSFLPLAHPDPPAVEDGGWCRTGVDPFIWARQQQEGLHPNPIADRRVLIRRAYLDLTGLPPSREEVEAFVNDPDPQAYVRLIDRLLESPGYGERWARYWLDVARFAESSGYEHDYLRPSAYPYRDFVIGALNQDMPFDRFVRWQLAGDELAPNDPMALMATGFLGAGTFPTQLTEAEFESARYDEMDDMLATTGVAFLGLSIGCARCHDHKFDPIPSRDYYRLLATFTTTIRSETELVVPWSGEVAKVQVSSEGLPHIKHHADERGYPHFYEQTYFLLRGDVHQKQEVAQPGYLEVLMRNGYAAEHWRCEPPEGWTRTSYRRASLANWITDVENGAGHLAARVIVNRLWQHHLGRGIVATPNDFGLQGERPTHPELLDWLAGQLIAHDWRLKPIHKLIMTSAVYMQSSAGGSRREALDPDNHYLWRFTPRRLEAEAIRDSMLHVAGLLDCTLYGPGTLDESTTRRSIYFTIKRSELIPSMLLFDWPEHLVSIGARAVTTTAPQALWLLNGDQVRRCAQALADRITQQRDRSGAPSRDEDAAARQDALLAYQLILARDPDAWELEAAADFLVRQRQIYEQQGRAPAEGEARVDLCQTLLSSNEFLYLP